MLNKRLGFLSASAIIAGIITALVITTIAFAYNNSLFSPGKLNGVPGNMKGGVLSHAQITKCSACHPSLNPSDHMADRCLVCHTEIKSEINDPASLHGILNQADPGLDCRHCHTDHNGITANMTTFKGDFPHEKLDFALTAHPEQTCTDCHKDSYKDFNTTLCADCHQTLDKAYTTAHILAFGSDCLACHDGLDSRGANFNHANTDFPLSGLHANVLCTKCHLNARTLADLQSAPIKCAGCHLQDDPHKGQFGTECETCHTSEGWKPAKFDHNLAAFKLTGKHVTTACEQCHVNQQFKGTPTDCASCHLKDDAHQGKFGANCNACHSTEGWKPANFDHNLAAFKLTGKHISVACEQCHVNQQFKGTPTDCVSCHLKDDAHQGKFGKNCSACHSTQGWKPAIFDHNLAAFKLTGKHVSVACGQCHINQQFKGTPTDCVSCHQKDDPHQGGFGKNCGACHSTQGWKPASFDHNLSGFPLTGAHANAACSACHKNNTYFGLPSACVNCHSDPAYHSGMFGTQCAECHNTSNWNATYTGPHPLIDEKNGMNHEGATCADCHTVSLHEATCTKCHDSNNPGDGGGDDD